MVVALLFLHMGANP